MSAAALVVFWLGAPSAHAQEAPAAAPPMAPPPDRPLFADTHLGVASSFGTDSPVVLLAGNTGAVTWGLGVEYKHDGAATTDKDSASGVLSLGYMVHNQFPFAMGPEVNFIGELAPKAFDLNVLQVGWAFWYAPFNIPAVIGTAVFVQTVFPPGGMGATVTSVTPAVRIVFGFH
jgi:hypothetical protein